MYGNKVEALDAVREARDCYARISRVIDETAAEARHFGDEDLLARLAAAKDAVRRAGELIEKLAIMIQSEQAEAQHPSD